MNLTMFAIKDQKANAFLQPFFMRSSEEASRAFENSVKDSKTNFYKHPEDYHLYSIAEFDDQTGTMQPYTEPLHILHAASVKTKLPDSAEIWEAINKMKDILDNKE